MAAVYDAVSVVRGIATVKAQFLVQPFIVF